MSSMLVIPLVTAAGVVVSALSAYAVARLSAKNQRDIHKGTVASSDAETIFNQTQRLHDNLVQELERLKERVEDDQRTINRLNTQREHDQQVIAELRDAVLNQRAEMSELRAEMHTNTRELERLRADNTFLRSETESMRRTAKATAEALELFRHEMSVVDGSEGQAS